MVLAKTKSWPKPTERTRTEQQPNCSQVRRHEEDEGCYTIGVAFKRAVISAKHQVALHDAVTRVHSITLFATELANLVVRHRLEHDPTTDLSWLFDANIFPKNFRKISGGWQPPLKISKGLTTDPPGESFLFPSPPPPSHEIYYYYRIYTESTLETQSTNVSDTAGDSVTTVYVHKHGLHRATPTLGKPSC